MTLLFLWLYPWGAAGQNMPLVQPQMGQTETCGVKEPISSYSQSRIAAYSVPPRSHSSWFKTKMATQLLTSTYKPNTPCLGRHHNRPTTRTITCCGCINKNYPSGRLEGCALEKRKRRLLRVPRTICSSFSSYPHSAELCLFLFIPHQKTAGGAQSLLPWPEVTGKAAIPSY